MRCQYSWIFIERGFLQILVPISLVHNDHFTYYFRLSRGFLMDLPDSYEQKKAILEYWTLVEFFSPYILENVLDPKQRYQKIYFEEEPRTPLPWQNAPIISEDDPSTPYAKGYHLYLGLFSVEETADLARHAFAERPSYWQSVNWRSCGDVSSTTCFARLTVTTHGIPLFGTMSLSTLPWAHGRLLEERKESLTVEEYWKGVNRLQELLKEEFHQEMPLRLVKEPKIHARYLDLDSLFKLVHHLQKWANFTPRGYPYVLIEPMSCDVTIGAGDPKIRSKRDVPILNSFYIHDLEAAGIALNQEQGRPLDCYLSDKASERIFLESEVGKDAIFERLRPDGLPLGRWLDNPLEYKNVMQQFAINTSLKETIFSVNGPPGTGKTSLLKEIIAENIVQRAAALSALKTAQSAFCKKHALCFESSDPIIVSELDPTLLGYEMVVVSSNNAAVQNISEELPERKKLDPVFQHASYLEPVARKVKEGSWGLISATLGNTENCRQFVEAVFTAPSASLGQMRIWEWIDSYNGKSFLEAKEAFVTLKTELDSHLLSLEEMAFLYQELEGQTVENYVLEEMQAVEEIEEEQALLAVKLDELLQKEKQGRELLQLLREREKLWKKERPHALSRIMDSKLADAWNEKESVLRKERIEAIDQLQVSMRGVQAFRAREQTLQENLSALYGSLLDRILQFYAFEEAYETAKKIHPGAQFPKDLVHTHFYYQTEKTNRLRSDLFISALQLHEAWLAEVLRVKGGFRGNLMAISNILQGKSPTTSEDTRIAWQSLFLMLPVISSTFASFGRLFRYLEPKTLGSVLIDEAGQALPQAAVGAIWRANHVLSIGDPFQIEPITTIPQEVIDGMAKSKIKDYTLNWAPSRVSVQNLMDRVSTFGSERIVRDVEYWLGSPLRVHRRCEEPMFSIANAIAYDGSMLLATNTKENLSLPASCWWDVSGNTSDRQYVPNQGDRLLQLVKEALIAMKAPDLFIISPFREVVLQLQRRFLEDKELCRFFEESFSTSAFHNWVRDSIGTVHTFQGKQAFAVFFVLGGDKSTTGAIEWASRKPNLLNVAVTRAQSRFYIIGDYDLWRIWPHFDIASKKLERKRIIK